MTTSDPGLEASNLMYRRPELYDHGRADPDGTVARHCAELINRYAPIGARTILDVGCGTGLDLEQLTQRFDCVGIDIQPQLVAYANQVRPGLDVRLGDMRTFRLGHSVDTIVCLGNALAYLHHDDDIHAAFATFAAHAHPGTLVIIVTQIAPTLTTPGQPVSRRIDTGTLRGTATLTHRWDPHTQIHTTQRHWHLDDGTQHDDTIRRRVLNPEQLEQHATHSGFTPLALFTNPNQPTAPLRGSTAWLVARAPDGGKRPDPRRAP